MQNINQREKTINECNKQGYDITNPLDSFFYDICKTFTSKDKKDVSLEYRRKYYYYPVNYLHNNKINQENIFYRPLRNSSSSCFKELIVSTKIYNNLSFYIILPSFLLQLFLFCIILIKRTKMKISNFSDTILDDENNSKLKDKIKTKNNNGFSKEIKEIKEKNENFPYRNNNNLPKNLDKSNKFGNYKRKALKLQFKDTIFEEEEQSSNADTNKTLDYFGKNSFISNNQLEKENEKYYKPNRTKEIKNTQNQLNQEKNMNADRKCYTKSKEIINENRFFKENNKKMDNQKQIQYFGNKSEENFSFGGKKEGGKLNLIFDSKENQNSELPLGIKIVNDIEKIKRSEYFFRAINRSSPTKMNNYVEQISHKKNSLKNDEYFYLDYIDTILNDKRTICKTYIDILSNSQIIFFFVTKHMYEDFKFQIIYYCIKIQIHFFLNIHLLNTDKINKIYNNLFGTLETLKNGISSSIITLLLSEIIYRLTNSKTIRIEKKNMIENLDIKEGRLNFLVRKYASNIIEKYTFSKHILLFILSCFTYCFCFYKCFSFCEVYPNTQNIVFYCILSSILISQISPFAFALIPAILRRKFIILKSKKLYKITKKIEIIFFF